MRISDWSSDVCSSDLGEDGDAFASNFVASVDGNTTGEHSAGNDTITAGDGGWFIAGDALASGRNGNASVNNNAGTAQAAAIAILGSDVITAGDGRDWISGDALALEGGTASLTSGGANASYGYRIARES